MRIEDDQLDGRRTEHTSNDDEGQHKDHRQTATDLTEHGVILSDIVRDEMDETDEKKECRASECEGCEKEG